MDIEEQLHEADRIASLPDTIKGYIAAEGVIFNRDYGQLSTPEVEHPKLWVVYVYDRLADTHIEGVPVPLNETQWSMLYLILSSPQVKRVVLRRFCGLYSDDVVIQYYEEGRTFSYDVSNRIKFEDSLTPLLKKILRDI